VPAPTIETDENRRLLCNAAGFHGFLWPGVDARDRTWFVTAARGGRPPGGWVARMEFGGTRGARPPRTAISSRTAVVFDADFLILKRVVEGFN